MIYKWIVKSHPVGQGSISPIPFRKKSGKLGVSVFQKPELLQYRQEIADTFRAEYKEDLKEMDELPFPDKTPVCVDISFFFVRAKSNRLPYPSMKGMDIDKGARAVLDALTGVVFNDDSQVVNLSVTKDWAEGEEYTHIQVCEITERFLSD